MEVFQIRPNFVRSRISAGFVKKGRISAGAEENNFVDANAENLHEELN